MITIYPNQQDAIYDAAAMPPGCSNRVVSISGGYLKWPNRWSIEEVLAVGQGEIRQALGNHFPEPHRYAGMRLVLDLEGEGNLGSQHDASEGTVRRLAEAADLRFIEASRHFPNSCELYAWCAGNAWQREPVPQDYGDVWGLVQMAKCGAFMAADGFAMRVFPPSGSDTIRTRFEKGREVFKNAARMGAAIADAARELDGVDRGVMLQGSFEQFGDDGRPGRDPLPPEDVAAQVEWAQDAGMDELGLWSGKATLESGMPAMDLLGRAVALAGSGGGGGSVNGQEPPHSVGVGG